VTLKLINNPAAPLRIHIDGVDDPLGDSRVVEAALNAMRFRKADAIGIEAGDCVAVLRPGKPAVARVGGVGNGAPLRSDVIITRARLERPNPEM